MKQINKQDKTYRNAVNNHDEHENTSNKHRKASRNITNIGKH